MVDPSALGMVAGLVQFLPEIMFWAQIAMYIFLIFFFGSIVMKGYRGHLRGIFHLLLRVGTGFACLVAGIGLSPLLPGIGDNPIIRMFQLDIIIGGLISSIVLLICFYIITFRFSRTLVVKKKMEALQRKFEKTKDRTPSKFRVDPLIIVGIAVIAVFLVFSLLNFRGFPSMSDDLFSQLGITSEEFSQMGDLLGGAGGEGGLEGLLPEGVVIEGGNPLTQQSVACMSGMLSLNKVQSQLQDIEFLMSHSYSDDAVKGMIESGSGKNVMQMFLITEGGSDIIIAMTDDSFACVATPFELCTCVGMSS